MRLALEPLNRFETSCINTAEQASRARRGVDSPALGVLLDTFHMNVEERDLPGAVAAASGRSSHFHACANDRGAPGRDHLDWPGIVGR